MLSAVKLARRKLSKNYAELTPTTGTILISADILHLFRKVLLFRMWVVLATVPDRHFGSGSGSKPNRCQIGGFGRQ